MADAERSWEVRVAGLSGAQETALLALRGGGTFGQAAEEAGVNRTTVYRWVRGDPHFRAAYNAWLQEASESATARLIKLADKAVDVVERALNRDDEKVAMKVLRGVGALRRRRKESTNPEVLDLKIKLRDRQELRAAETGMLRHVLEKVGMSAREQKAVLSGGPATGKFLKEVRRELARRDGSPDPAGDPGSAHPGACPPPSSADASGDASSRPSDNEPTAPGAEAEDCDKCCDMIDLHPELNGPPPAAGHASSDASPEGDDARAGGGGEDTSG